MHIKTICNWINELADENPKEFGEYFYDDIRNYLNFAESTDDSLESNIKEICGSKFNELSVCGNKEEVKKWLDKISGNIIMKFDTESSPNPKSKTSIYLTLMQLHKTKTRILFNA